MSQLLNHVRVTQEMATPVSGMGATLVMHSDREPYTILTVSKSGKSFTMQEDSATRNDMNGMSESQDCTFAPNPSGHIVTVRMTKKGWRMSGCKVLVGVRDSYYDYSF